MNEMLFCTVAIEMNGIYERPGTEMFEKQKNNDSPQTQQRCFVHLNLADGTFLFLLKALHNTGTTNCENKDEIKTLTIHRLREIFPRMYL